jgi:hypothetical protein
VFIFLWAAKLLVNSQNNKKSNLASYEREKRGKDTNQSFFK